MLGKIEKRDILNNNSMEKSEELFEKSIKYHKLLGFFSVASFLTFYF